MNAGRLTIRKGKFLFADVSNPKTRLKLHSDAHWKNLGNDTYETRNLGAARVYRKFADDRTEKIFQKTFQSFYTEPENPERFSLRLLRSLPLDSHQLDGIRWVLTRKRSYLAHAPGAGKTAEAILASCIAKGEGPVLFIVPPSLVLNWEREIIKFTEWVGRWPAIGVVQKTPQRDRTPWRADFIICPDSLLTKDWVYEKLKELKFRFIAVDEASRFKDPFAARSLALFGGRDGERNFSGLCKEARHVVLLDGSPMPNRPMELWGPTYALHPEAIDCMDQNDFGYRYCGARPNERGEWEFLYSSNEDELRGKLQKDFMHVVSEGELDHPERKRKMVFLSEDVRSEEHREWERKNLERFELGVRFWGTVGAEELSTGEMARFRRQLGIRKVPLIVRYVRERIEMGENVLVFVWHREVAEQIAASIHEKDGAGPIIGGVSLEVREKAFRSFQDGRDNCLIMNIAAAGRGLNLQKADRVVFGEFSWTDETNKQCEKRTSRKGSDKVSIPCDYLVCPNSMDEVVLKSVFSKEKRVKKVIG